MSVLNKLGSSLVNTLKKVLKANVVDEAVVKDLVKDLQRALLQSDINVHLVFELSKRIEKKSLNEKLPPGISRREHVLKVVYDEFIKLLGEKPAKIPVKNGMTNVFMLIGIQGSGKCIEGNTKVPLANGKMNRIAELFDKSVNSGSNLVFLSDGEVVQSKSFELFSMNPKTLKMEIRPVEWVWRLRAPKELCNVQLDTEQNIDVTTTPEHLFFIVENDGVQCIRSDCLQKGHHVLTQPIIPNKRYDKFYFDSECRLLQENAESVEVKKVSKIENHSIEYVYDLTIKDNHNFVANGVIIHNTTSAAKLARFYQKRGFNSSLVCADVYRPGAYAQLKQTASSINVPFFGLEDEEDAVKIALQGVKKFRKENYDIIILDTAGRHKEEKSLIEEMKNMARVINPDEIILVVDATIGQQATVQAKAFSEATKIGSIIVTKLDGTARGGGALSAVASTSAPIVFIGTGEKTGEIETFIPSRFVSRLLGMGDLEGLVQRVKEAEVNIPKKKAVAMLRGKFTLEDMYDQIEAVKKLGPLKRVIGMLPGMGYSLSDKAINVAEDRVKKWRYIIQSMTDDEKENPKVINSSRIKRIANGSGTNEKEVKELKNQYFQMRKLLKNMRGRRFRQIFGKKSKIS